MGVWVWIPAVCPNAKGVEAAGMPAGLVAAKGLAAAGAAVVWLG